MKKKAIGILAAVLIFAVATGLVFADSADKQSRRKTSAPDTEVAFAASITFDSDRDGRLTLRLNNLGKREMRVAPQANYIDNAGSAGSTPAAAKAETNVKPGQTARIPFQLENACDHGENSILSFFFQYDGYWYLGKVGPRNGIEYYRNHD